MSTPQTPTKGTEYEIRGDDPSDAKRDSRWWLAEKGKVYERLIPTVRRIHEQHRWRDLQDDQHYRLYENMPVSGIRPTGAPVVLPSNGNNRLSFNLCRAVADAWVAEIVNSKPKAMVVASGDWTMQHRAKEMDRWQEGMFDLLEFYQTRHNLLQHCATWGAGICKTWADTQAKEVRCERILPFCLMRDSTESMYGPTRTIYEYRWVDRLMLMAAFPEFADKIKTANPKPIEFSRLGWDTTSDLVCVIEAYHLPSKKGAEDGMRAMVLGDIDLVATPWDKPYFPYTEWFQQDALLGDRPIGIVGRLMGLQRELSKLVGAVQRGMHYSVGHWIMEAGSVNDYKLDNAYGSALEYKPGSPVPQFVVPGIMSPEVYQHIDRIWTKGFEQEGLNQLGASGVKPPGLDSGEAQRVYNDKASRRLGVASRNDEFAVLDVARKMQAAAREVIANGGSLSARVAKAGRLSIVDFGKVVLAEKDHQVVLFPTSALARDPAQRMAQINDMVKNQVIDAKMARRLYDMPDIDTAMSLEDSSYELTQDMIDRIIEDGEFIGPMSQMDLAESIRWFGFAFLKGKRDGVPQDRLDMLTDWIQQAKDIITPPPTPPPPPGLVPPAEDPNAMQAPPPPVAPAPPMAPQGAPPGAPMQ